VGSAAGGPVTGSAPSTSEGLAPNVAGALAYFTIIPAIIFLVVEPYNRDRFVRFHAFQCLFLAAGLFGFFLVLGIFAMIPFIGWLVGLLLFPLLGLAAFVVVVFCMYKAYKNEKFMLPVIGKLAEQQASR
jgi:uncharacterized membrane protein